jgi:hypothetical protein
MTASKFMRAARPSTVRLIEMMDAGELDARTLATACINHMDEAEVKDMAESNEFIEDDDTDEDDDESDLYPYIVLYRDTGTNAFAAPLAFKCEADDGDHAEEQCQDANPDSEVVWVHQSDDVQAALDDYHTNGKKEDEG